MQGRARLSEQTLIERVSHQRVFENIILRFVVPINQVEGLHGGKAVVDLLLAHGGAKKLRIKLLSDHRGRLQERAVLSGKTVDAGGEQVLHTGGQSRRYGIDVELQRSRADAHDIALGEVADDFLGEKRITFGLLGYRARQRLG